MGKTGYSAVNLNRWYYCMWVKVRCMQYDIPTQCNSPNFEGYILLKCHTAWILPKMRNVYYMSSLISVDSVACRMKWFWNGECEYFETILPLIFGFHLRGSKGEKTKEDGEPQHFTLSEDKLLVVDIFLVRYWRVEQGYPR